MFLDFAQILAEFCQISRKFARENILTEVSCAMNADDYQRAKAEALRIYSVRLISDEAFFCEITNIGAVRRHVNFTDLS